jgi:hypothetical protein
LFLQRLQALLPSRIERGDPFADDVAKRAPLERVKALASFSPFTHEPSFPEQAEMSRNSRPRYVELGRDLTGRQLASVQQLENLAAPTVGDGAEHGIGGIGHELTVNNIVKYVNMDPIEALRQE